MAKIKELTLDVKHTHKVNMIVCSITNYLIKNKDEFTFNEVEQFLELLKNEINKLKNSFLDN